MINFNVSDIIVIFGPLQEEVSLAITVEVN